MAGFEILDDGFGLNTDGVRVLLLLESRFYSLAIVTTPIRTLLSAQQFRIPHRWIWHHFEVHKAL